MSTLVQNLTQAATGAQITDQVVASDMLASTKLECMALTTATLEAATPELRRFFQESLIECLESHERLFELVRKNGWYQTYASPREQLELELRMSEGATGNGE